MRGILIDPGACAITEIELESFDELYPIIGCELVQPVPGDSSNTIWLDEEGLLKPDPQLYQIGEDIYAGKTVVLGGTPQDEDVTSCEVPLSFFSTLVTFRPDICYAGMSYKVEEVVHPHLGRMTQHTQTAVYRPRSVS